MELVDIQCLIAAILTVASTDKDGSSPRNTVNRYVNILAALREAGDHRSPREIDPR